MIVFWVILTILLLYGLTDILFRWMGYGALAFGERNRPLVALTFDDGPSKQSVKVLELLDKYQTKATFFVTGRAALEYPEILEQMRAAGHQLEAHGYWHRLAPLMAPWTEWLHIKRSPGRLYRPPWGVHSLFTRFLVRLASKQVALWSLESRDWLDEDPDRQATRILRYMRPGDVLLLHDGPQRTLALLELLLPRLKQAGYTPVTMDALEARPLNLSQALQRAMMGAEERYDHLHHTIRIGQGPYDLLRIERKTYDGPPIAGLPRDVAAIELHLESARMTGLSPFQIVKALKRGLIRISVLVAEDPEIQLVYGRSFYVSGAERIGLTALPLTGLDGFLSSMASRWFVWLYRMNGITNRRMKSRAFLLYVPREDLLERYPPAKSL